MDSEENPPSKRRKITPKLSFLVLPPEIRTEIYKHAVLPPDTKREKRVIKTVTSDSTINALDSVQHFFVYEILDGGKNMVIAEGIVGVPELADDVLSLMLPQILFKFSSRYTLAIFARTIAAHTYKKLKKGLVLNVEINLTDTMTMAVCCRKLLESWEPPTKRYQLPHGNGIGMRRDVDVLFKAVAKLPRATIIYLVVSHVWRDFQTLRSLSRKYKISEREVKFQFPAPINPRQDYDFFIAQTIAAVKDIVVQEQIDISAEKREELVKIGCTGFDSLRRSSRKAGERKRTDGD